ncbi:ATP-grasp domain-containing protein [Photorhabdus heterorhabditis]|uniref:ATP-grasp domain-containing protein n=1 Tax=Photorhabdus heterorhabditis TaxID=880156 RepID=UPI001561CCA1|nr:ATP-grasp domain-containing protein [Photorhabdus heterorhabditis]NRN28677.1 hypothetical protein [Photorhabdus heterorhabditis subsp. aluminescens]
MSQGWNPALALEEALKYEDIVLMEEFILGLEFTVCFLSGEVLPFLSINHSHKFFNYDAKFKSGDTLFDLVNFDGRTNKLIVSQTKKILDFLNINDYCRLDFIMKGNVPYLLELNTLPGLNSHSVFVKAALLYGMSYEEIIMSIINGKK